MRLHLHVKFRALGITFYTVDAYPQLPFVIPPMEPRELYDSRGVLLELVI